MNDQELNELNELYESIQETSTRIAEYFKDNDTSPEMAVYAMLNLIRTMNHVEPEMGLVDGVEALLDVMRENNKEELTGEAVLRA